MSPSTEYRTTLQAYIATLAAQIFGVHCALYACIMALSMAKAISRSTAKNGATYVDGSLFALGLGLSGMVLSLLALLVQKYKY